MIDIDTIAYIVVICLVPIAMYLGMHYERAKALGDLIGYILKAVGDGKITEAEFQEISKKFAEFLKSESETETKPSDAGEAKTEG